MIDYFIIIFLILIFVFKNYNNINIKYLLIIQIFLLIYIFKNKNIEFFTDQYENISIDSLENIYIALIENTKKNRINIKKINCKKLTVKNNLDSQNITSINKINNEINVKGSDNFLSFNINGKKIIFDNKIKTNGNLYIKNLESTGETNINKSINISDTLKLANLKSNNNQNTIHINGNNIKLLSSPKGDFKKYIDISSNLNNSKRLIDISSPSSNVNFLYGLSNENNVLYVINNDKVNIKTVEYKVPFLEDCLKNDNICKNKIPSGYVNSIDMKDYFFNHKSKQIDRHFNPYGNKKKINKINYISNILNRKVNNQFYGSIYDYNYDISFINLSKNSDNNTTFILNQK